MDSTEELELLASLAFQFAVKDMHGNEQISRSFGRYC